MSEPFLGEIKIFAGTFAIRGYAFCDGQLLQISQNDALFSLLGTIYGGDGRTTFALPDLRGRLPIHMGNGPGLTPRPIGSKAGDETVTVTTNQLPVHTHTMQAVDETAAQSEPAGKMLARTQGDVYVTDSAVAMNTASITASGGGGQSHTNIQPFLCVNFIIALVGVYPSRN